MKEDVPLVAATVGVMFADFLAGELELESEESEEILSLVPGLAMLICNFLSARGTVFLEEEKGGELMEGGRREDVVGKDVVGEDVVGAANSSKDLSPTASFGTLFGLASIHLMMQR